MRFNDLFQTMIQERSAAFVNRVTYEIR